jgi:outer membrane immunogenic protein
MKTYQRALPPRADVSRFGFAVGAIAALVGPLAAPALAADLARPPIYTKALPVPVASWTGCYLGANLGGAWSKTDFAWDPNRAGFFNPGVAPAIASQTAATLDASGVSGGGQLGCNYQMSNWVVGIEGDIQGTGLSATNSGTILNAGNADPFTETFHSHWLSTVRGRLGFVFGQWLFYGTGGAAFANASFSDSVFFPGSGTTNAAAGSATLTGWTAGGGAEWMFAPRWSLKGEYLYADLGSFSYTSANSNPAAFPLATITHSHRVTESLARAGLNFHF